VEKVTLALPADIVLGLKDLPRTNALAFYEKALLKAVKSLITLAPAQYNFTMDATDAKA
jgi:hypothetical protein